jgi:hypothetical protein
MNLQYAFTGAGARRELNSAIDRFERVVRHGTERPSWCGSSGRRQPRFVWHLISANNNHMLAAQRVHPWCLNRCDRTYFPTSVRREGDGSSSQSSTNFAAFTAGTWIIVALTCLRVRYVTESSIFDRAHHLPFHSGARPGTRLVRRGQQLAVNGPAELGSVAGADPPLVTGRFRLLAYSDQVALRPVFEARDFELRSNSLRSRSCTTFR